jgi:hypothetical protein
MKQTGKLLTQGIIDETILYPLAMLLNGMGIIVSRTSDQRLIAQWEITLKRPEDTLETETSKT